MELLRYAAAMPARKPKAPPRPDILLRIVDAAAGTCACGTLEAELTWHHPGCLWRVLSEAAFEIEALRKQIEAPEIPSVARRSSGGKKAADRRQGSLMLPVKGGRKR